MPETSEGPSPIHETTEHRPTLKVQKKDVIDKAIDNDAYFPPKVVTGALAASFATVVGGILTGERDVAELGVGAVALTGSLFTTDIFLSSVNGPEAKDSVDRSTYVNDSLSFRADRLVYSGKTPINVEGNEFKKGSNFYLIQLPAVPGVDARIGNAVSLQTDLNNFALRQVRMFIERKDHDFVAIDPRTLERPPYSAIPQGNSTMEQALSGKPAEISDPQRPIVVLTKERFQELATTVHEMFEKGILGTEDVNLINSLRVAKAAKTPEERAKAASFLNRRLSAILEREMESHFNALPEVKITRDPATFAPIRQKSHMSSSIKNVKGRFMYVQINSTTGEIRSNPVSKLLKTDDQTLYEVLGNKSPLRKTQIAYLLREMIEDYGIEQLLENKELSEPELIQKLADFTARTKLGLGMPRTPARQIVKPYRSTKAKKQAKAGLVGAASLATLVGFAGVTGSLLRGINSDRGEVWGGELEPGQLSDASSRLEFPGIPKSGVEWKIDGNMPTEGYYMTGTSNDFRDGRWHQNEEIDEIVSFPKDVAFDSDERHLTLTRLQPLNQMGETAIRIPIRENTRLVSLNLLGPDNQNIDFITQRLTDGSIRVVVPPKFIDSLPFASIQASFVPSDQSMVHAHGPTREIKYDALSQDAQAILGKARSMSEEEGILMLQNYIQNSRQYSIDPPDKHELNGVSSPESAVNAIEGLSGCSCEICNTEFVLLADSLGDQRDINIAYGFMGTDASPGGADVDTSLGSYLRSDTAHAFGIDEDGTIRDATASEIAADTLTQEYIRRLRSSEINGLNLKHNWKVKELDLKKYADEQKAMNDMLKLAGLAIVGGIGVAGIRSLYPLVRRGVSRKNLLTLADTTVANSIPSESLEQAYNFFMWTSWASQGGRSYSQIPLNVRTKKEALDKIRSSISYDKLTVLLQDPKEFEKKAKGAGFNISSMDYSHLQMLATYLINT